MFQKTYFQFFAAFTSNRF